MRHADGEVRDMMRIKKVMSVFAVLWRFQCCSKSMIINSYKSPNATHTYMQVSEVSSAAAFTFLDPASPTLHRPLRRPLAALTAVPAAHGLHTDARVSLELWLRRLGIAGHLHAAVSAPRTGI